MRSIKKSPSLLFFMAGAVLVFALSAGAGQRKTASAPSALRVVGPDILNSNNERVTLRGVNTACMEWSSDGERGRILKTVRTAIEDWHVNIIRLPLSQDRWFGKAPEQKGKFKAYRNLVKKVVDLCSSNGCYIILDLHWSNADQEWGQNIGQHSMPDKKSILFWQDLASVYANHPAVIFDLYNEPHDIGWDVWLNGGTVMDQPNKPGQVPVEYEAVGMQEMLDTVRATGAKNVVLVGGIDWTYDFSGILEGRQLKDPDGNGVIYANHAYNNKNKSVFSWISQMEEATAKFPVIVSEFGGSGGPDRRREWWGSSPATAIGDDWLMHVMKVLGDHNWSWIAWDMHVAAGPSLISDWDYTPTADFGIFVKQMLAGKPVSYTPPDPAQLAAGPGETEAEKLYGDWYVEAEAGEHGGGSSILFFFPDSKGRPAGQWINNKSASKLEDVRFSGNIVSFSQTVEFGREDIYEAKFNGMVDGERLSGTFFHGVSESKIYAKRNQEIPPAFGGWEMSCKAGDDEVTATLIIKKDKKGKPTAEWKSERGKNKISKVRCDGSKLSFKRTNKLEGRQLKSTFEGVVEPQADTLSGVIKLQGGKIEVEGKRIGTELIGVWNLDVTEPYGIIKQRLKVNRDMSGVYGTSAIEKIIFEGNDVSFKIVHRVGTWKFETTFEGKLEGSRLTGKIKTHRGIQKVVGTK